LKTHELTYYTGAVKNFFGVLPLKCRREIHLLGKRDLFGEAVADLYSIVKPSFAVMDGVIGMEGNGPSHGNPINSGVILASKDCVSLDIVAAELIGFDSLKIPTTAGVLKKGFENQCPVIVGTPLQEAKMRFQKSSGGVTTVPPFLTRRFGKYFTIYPRINRKKCTRCGACYLNCSPQAVEKLKDGEFRINEKKCILCYCCRELCPNNAVDIKKSLLATLLTEKENLLDKNNY
jgi:ferredoxin